MTKIRIPINVKVFDNKTGKMVWNASSTLKSKILNLTSDILRQNRDIWNDVSLEATVTYSRKQDSWNAFVFRDVPDLERKLRPVLELNLLKELKASDMLDPKYLS